MISLILSLSLHYSFCQDVYKKLARQDYNEENITVCSLLIEDSKIQEINFEIVLATAWEESRFTQQNKPTRFKCFGPLQIKYQYWCPNNKGKISAIKPDGKISNCDPYYHGVRALKYYISKFNPLSKALCYYNNSKKCKNSYMSDYVKRVLTNLKKIKTILKEDKYKSL